jgi:hypothetical protein
MKKIHVLTIAAGLLGATLAQAGIYSNMVYSRNVRLAYAMPYHVEGTPTHGDTGYIDVVMHSSDHGDRDCGSYVDLVGMSFSRNTADWAGWITNSVMDLEFRTFGDWVGLLPAMDRFPFPPCGSFNGRHRTWRAVIPFEKAQFFLHHDHLHGAAPRHYDPVNEVTHASRAPTYKIQPDRDSADGHRYGMVGHGIALQLIQVTGFKSSHTFNVSDFATGSRLFPEAMVSYPAYLVEGSLLVQKHKVARGAGIVARVMLDDLSHPAEEPDPMLNPAVWIEAVYQYPFDRDGRSNIEVWSFKGAVPIARHTAGFSTHREIPWIDFIGYARESGASRAYGFQGSPWEPFGGLIPLAARQQADRWCWDFLNNDPGTRWQWYRLATEYDPLFSRVPFAW